MSRRIWLSLLLLAALVALWAPQATQAQDGRPLVLVLTADGPLTPAMLEYLERGIRAANDRGAELLVLQLNTPGGSTDLMQSMVEAIRASNVPVAVYITPRGAMAGSAGTVVTLAGHVAAMAPETAIGAASPVGGQGEDLGQTLEAKLKNIMKATVRSLAERRGQRAVDLAESTIESAAAASAEEALDAGLVDFIANDLNELVRQLNGFSVETLTGPRPLNTENAEVDFLALSFIEQLLNTLTNPNIVFLLITIGVQAILIEISSPGGWVAGFIGVICLALATYGLGILPVNWFGIIFLILAFVLFIVDIKAPTHGALTAAGVGSLIVGALVLFNSPSVPSFQRVSVPLIIGMSLFTGASFFIILMFALRAQRTPVRMGQASMVGRTGVVRTPLAPAGTVQVASELWTAESLEAGETLLPGTRVRVERVEGVRLYVRKER
jgi:membrane-bound serine protease (ClpP class)